MKMCDRGSKTFWRCKFCLLFKTDCIMNSPSCSSGNDLLFTYTNSCTIQANNGTWIQPNIAVICQNLGSIVRKYRCYMIIAVVKRSCDVTSGRYDAPVNGHCSQQFSVKQVPYITRAHRCGYPPWSLDNHVCQLKNTVQNTMHFKRASDVDHSWLNKRNVGYCSH